MPSTIARHCTLATSDQIISAIRHRWRGAALNYRGVRVTHRQAPTLSKPRKTIEIKNWFRFVGSFRAFLLSPGSAGQGVLQQVGAFALRLKSLLRRFGSGDCNAPNALMLPFRIELTATA
jgi:hypothetical protein